MLGALARRLFGSANDRYVKSLGPIVSAINEIEPQLEAMSDDELRARTARFKEQLADGAELDDLLVDAFATVREAAKRTLGQRHFDVQLMGGIVLHRGMIAEMKTGEGKTLVATLPVYLNALTGNGVHVVTVNDYLARRDAEWMGQIYRFLGLTVGCIVHELDDMQRQQAYLADVTYGTNNELGFDYLRDNMKFRLEDMVHRPFHYAIVDEVDSILIDEARTPLIISGPTEDNSELYIRVDKLIPALEPDDYEKDEKQRTVTLTESGVEKIETMLRDTALMVTGSLYDIHNVSLVHHVNQALRAHKLFARDTDYIVKDDKIIIIDEFTGRMMEGRRYSEGLHQALEAKEGVTVQNENQTLASITFQNYFRLYPKLAGMTGTAMTEVAGIRRHLQARGHRDPDQRAGAPRRHRRRGLSHARAKNTTRSSQQVLECRERQQPVLVGTVSIEKSEALAALFKKHKIPHNVLNARYHEQEAYIIAQAGRPGAVTIATNMAGRGTDIQLGGNLEMRLRTELATIEDLTEREARGAAIRAGDRDGARGSRASRRALRRRQRAAREPPHRQSAARPLRPSGRSGRLEILRLARRRSDADLRVRADGFDAAASRPQRGRGDHPPVGQQGARQGAAKGRGAQLRHPQAAAQIRRCHERPAQGDLRAAARDHERARCRGDDRRYAQRDDRGGGSGGDPGKRAPRAMGHRRAPRRMSASAGSSICRSPSGPRRRASPTTR